MPTIPNSRVLIIATDGFEEWELFGPRQILQERGAEVVLASLKLDPIQATVHDDPGKTIRPDLTVDQASADDFDALILPGGVRNPDQLRLHDNVIELIRDFDDQGKPIGAICHGPWLLVEADLLDGRTATSWPSIRTDLRNAGANVVDEAGGHRRQYRHQPQARRCRGVHQCPDRSHRGSARDYRSRGYGRNRRLTDWKPIACIGPGMDTGLIERIEGGTARGASALFAGGVGYAAYGLAAAAGIEPRLGLCAAGAGALAYLPCSRLLGTPGAHGPHYALPDFAVRDFEFVEDRDELLLTERLTAADELVLTDADRLHPEGSASIHAPLVLDDILAEIGPDARVVRLFDRKAMPAARLLRASFNHASPVIWKAGRPNFPRPMRPPPDASEALSAALAELRRSLR